MKSTFSRQKLDFQFIARFFDGVDFFLLKSRLSYLDPGISANDVFSAKKSIKLYPPVFWRSLLFPAKKSIFRHSPVFRWGRHFCLKVDSRI